MTLLSYLRQRLFCLLEVRYDRRWNIAVVFMALSKFMNFMKYLGSYPVNKIVLERESFEFQNLMMCLVF